MRWYLSTIYVHITFYLDTKMRKSPVKRVKNSHRNAKAALKQPDEGQTNQQRDRHLSRHPSREDRYPSQEPVVVAAAPAA